MAQIILYVLQILKSDRQADCAVGDAEARTLLLANAHVGRGGRVGDEGFRIPEIVGNRDQLEPVHDLEGPGLATGDLEGDDRAATTHLLQRKRLLRMVGTGWIPDARDTRLVRKKIGN